MMKNGTKKWIVIAVIVAAVTVLVAWLWKSGNLGKAKAKLMSLVSKPNGATTAAAPVQDEFGTSGQPLPTIA